MIANICGLIIIIGLDILAWLMIASSIENDSELKSGPYHKKDSLNIVFLGIFCTIVVLFLGWCAVSLG